MNRAAIYARYSSENQRPESIDDQISSCRKFAIAQGLTVLDDHIYSDRAMSGLRQDRPRLEALVQASADKQFDLVLIDDLSRLARDNRLMLTLVAEFQFHGVKVISVADGLDTEDEEAAIGIQVRGIVNELYLKDLKKKVMRGQLGQKDRGFFVGERTYGYESKAVGVMRMNKKGRLQPEGYKMMIRPNEAQIIQRIFDEFSKGYSISRIVKHLNTDNIPGRLKHDKAWGPSTIHRMLINEKYMGRWIWNRTGTRRDPKTGRSRHFLKPESEWVTTNDEALRIVSPTVWDQVQARLKDVRKSWPGGKGKKGFQQQHGSAIVHYPNHLLSGSMVCGVCGHTICVVSGKGGGYFGCARNMKKGCSNKLIVRRSVVERTILNALIPQLTSIDTIRYVLKKVEKEVARQSSTVPETLRLKQAALEKEEIRLRNYLEFIANGKGSNALADALLTTEQAVEGLKQEVNSLRELTQRVFEAPPKEWIEEQIKHLPDILEQRTPQSALLLRKLLGPIRLEPCMSETGKPYYRAISSLNVLSLLAESPQTPSVGYKGSNVLKWLVRRL